VSEVWHCFWPHRQSTRPLGAWRQCWQEGLVSWPAGGRLLWLRLLRVSEPLARSKAGGRVPGHSLSIASASPLFSLGVRKHLGLTFGFTFGLCRFGHCRLDGQGSLRQVRHGRVDPVSGSGLSLFSRHVRLPRGSRHRGCLDRGEAGPLVQGDHLPGRVREPLHGLVQPAELPARVGGRRGFGRVQPRAENDEGFGEGERGEDRGRNSSKLCLQREAGDKMRGVLSFRVPMLHQADRLSEMVSRGFHINPSSMR